MLCCLGKLGSGDACVIGLERMFFCRFLFLSRLLSWLDVWVNSVISDGDDSGF